MSDKLRAGHLSDEGAREFNRLLSMERSRRELAENLRRKDLTNDAIAMQRERANGHHRLAMSQLLIRWKSGIVISSLL